MTSNKTVIYGSVDSFGRVEGFRLVEDEATASPSAGAYGARLRIGQQVWLWPTNEGGVITEVGTSIISGGAPGNSDYVRVAIEVDADAEYFRWLAAQRGE